MPTVTNIRSVKPGGGGDFTSLAAWEAATQGNLVALDTIEIAECYAGVDLNATTVIVDGWTTSALNNIQIRAVSTGRPSGVFDATKYVLRATDAMVLTVLEDFVTLDGLQFEEVAPTIAHVLLGFGAGASLRPVVSNCIFKGHGSAVLGQKAYTASFGNALTVSFLNCLFFNFGTGGVTRILETQGGATVVLRVYSCTLVGGTAGLTRASGTVTAKNCYVGGSSIACFSGTVALTTSASSDATGSVGHQGIPASTANFVSVTPGAENFHLVSGAALVGAGTNTSGEAAPLNFTTDIDGQVRPLIWDIGADQFFAATPSGVTNLASTTATQGELIHDLQRKILTRVNLDMLKTGPSSDATTYRLADPDQAMYRKILLRLNLGFGSAGTTESTTFSPGDNDNDLLRKILIRLNAGVSLTGTSQTETLYKTGDSDNIILRRILTRLNLGIPAGVPTSSDKTDYVAGDQPSTLLRKILTRLNLGIITQ